MKSGGDCLILDDLVVVYKSNFYNLLDYKIFCFDGEVKFVYVSDSQRHLIQFYDSDFVPLNIKRRDYSDFEAVPSKPDSFEKMKHLASLLSKGIPHVRMDFYEINNQIYFGEMTFYTGSGFIPFIDSEWDYKLGSWFKLP